MSCISSTRIVISIHFHCLPWNEHGSSSVIRGCLADTFHTFVESTVTEHVPEAQHSAKRFWGLLAWGMHISSRLSGKINGCRWSSCWFKQFWSFYILYSFRFQVELAHLLRRAAGSPAAGSKSLVFYMFCSLCFDIELAQLFLESPQGKAFTK